MKSDAVRSFLMQSKKRPLILLFALLGLACLLFGGLRLGGGEESASPDEDESYRLMLEARLADLLSRVEGVGSPEVFVTLEKGRESVYSGGKLQHSEPPQILGVAVVCYGGGRNELRAELSALISSLFGIGSHRIHISEKSS